MTIIGGRTETFWRVEAPTALLGGSATSRPTDPAPRLSILGCMSVDHARRELDCDLLVVGGGAAGLAGAVTAAYHGLKVIVAE